MHKYALNATQICFKEMCAHTGNRVPPTPSRCDPGMLCSDARCSPTGILLERILEYVRTMRTSAVLCMPLPPAVLPNPSLSLFLCLSSCLPFPFPPPFLSIFFPFLFFPLALPFSFPSSLPHLPFCLFSLPLPPPFLPPLPHPPTPHRHTPTSLPFSFPFSSNLVKVNENQ